MNNPAKRRLALNSSRSFRIPKSANGITVSLNSALFDFSICFLGYKSFPSTGCLNGHFCLLKTRHTIACMKRHTEIFDARYSCTARKKRARNILGLSVGTGC